MSAVSLGAPEKDRAASGPRLVWVDAARGWCVVAVVLFHVIAWLYAELPVTGPAAAAWDRVNALLGNVRMPVLLAVSGLVLARTVREGLTRRGSVARAAGTYYLYVVWVLVYAGFFLLVSERGVPARIPVDDVPLELLVPTSPLWYVLALAVYTLALAALHRVPPAVVLTGLAVLAAATHVLDGLDGATGEAQWVKVPRLAFFFAVGVYGAPLLRRAAGRVTWPAVAVTVVAALAAHVVSGRLPGPVAAVLFPVRGLVFLVAAVAAVAWLCRWAPAATAGAWLGRRTLGVYVLHPLLIAVLLVLQRGPLQDAAGALARSGAGALLLPLVVTAVLVVVAVALQSLAERTPARVLFAMPPALRRAVAGRPPV